MSGTDLIVLRVVAVLMVAIGLIGVVWIIAPRPGSLTPYDAYDVLLARRLSAPLVTADGRLVRARARTSDRVLHLRTLSA